MKIGKNGHNYPIFGQNGSRFCTPVEPSKNIKLLCLNQNNLMPSQTTGSHFVFWQKLVFSSLETPGSGPGVLFKHKNGFKSKFL